MGLGELDSLVKLHLQVENDDSKESSQGILSPKCDLVGGLLVGAPRPNSTRPGLQDVKMEFSVMMLAQGMAPANLENLLSSNKFTTQIQIRFRDKTFRC